MASSSSFFLSSSSSSSAHPSDSLPFHPPPGLPDLPASIPPSDSPPPDHPSLHHPVSTSFGFSSDCSSPELHSDCADSDNASLLPDFASVSPGPADESLFSLSRCSSSSSIITDATIRASCRTDHADLDSETFESPWTDDKHRSYLTFMEENFVRDMYDREYCALDLCGQAPCSHSEAALESQPSSHQFKSWKNGDWQWRSMPKHFSNPSKTHRTLIQNPWINHFWQPTSAHAELDLGQNKNIDGIGNDPFLSTGNSATSERAPCCQSATSRKIDNTSGGEVEGARGSEKWKEKDDVQHLRSILNPGKRNLLPDCEWRTPRRQKLCDEHTAANGGE